MKSQMKRILALTLLAGLGFAAGCGATKRIVINTETSALAGRIEREMTSTVTVDSSTTETIANATSGTYLTCKGWDGQTVRVPQGYASANLAELESGTTTAVELHVTYHVNGRVTASCKPR
jgi:hypothetical protein